MNETYEYYSDPAHAWLRVPLSHVRNAGFRPSPFSYRDASDAWLEEDCDGPGFVAAARAKGWTITIGEASGDHPEIRSLAHFRA